MRKWLVPIGIVAWVVLIAGCTGGTPDTGGGAYVEEQVAEIGVEFDPGEADADSVWTESLDYDSDGAAEDLMLVWDDEDGILYAYAYLTLDCLAGEGTADGGALMGIYGDETECGSAVLDQVTGEITIIQTMMG